MPIGAIHTRASLLEDKLRETVLEHASGQRSRRSFMKELLRRNREAEFEDTKVSERLAYIEAPACEHALDRGPRVAAIEAPDPLLKTVPRGAIAKVLAGLSRAPL